MNEVEVLQSLLKKVNKIVDEHNAIIEERRKRGELFNIFDVLGLDSDEVRCHSAFIGELLNVNGNHGQGSSFLDAFISATEIKDLGLNTDAEYCKTDKEVYVGKVTDEEGGRVDILIHSAQKAIIIENKIYASDGYKQLIRYNNVQDWDKFIVLYLTLEGSKPDETSTKNKQGKICEYKCISYRKHILSWLDRCIKLAAEKPPIREVIIQYKNLILSLTNQFMDIKENENEEKLLNLITTKENIKGVVNILQSRDKFYKKCFEKYLFPKLDEVAKNRGFDFKHKYNLKNGDPDLFMFFYEEDSSLLIKFAFEYYNFRGLMWGLDNKENNPNTFKAAVTTVENQELDKNIAGLFKFTTSKKKQFAYGWSYVDDEVLNWDNQQTFMDVIQSDKFADMVDKRIKEVSNAKKTTNAKM